MKKTTKRFITRSLLLVFLLMNTMACFHAYRFSHFGPASLQRPLPPEQMSLGGKLEALLFGVKLPRSPRQTTPEGYTDVVLMAQDSIAAWHKVVPDAKGTVLLFHGYKSNKLSQLHKAQLFNAMGYSTFLIDFRGHGNSSGNTCSLGYYEADDVAAAVAYIKKTGEANIVLQGSSMGAVSILKYLRDTDKQPTAVILECPFHSMYATTCARFRGMGVPSFPMANLLLFWGGVQGGFWGFSHNPSEYAKKVTCPTLLLHGGKDVTISVDEVLQIEKNLAGPKVFKLFEQAGHEDYTNKYETTWLTTVDQFLATHTKGIK